MPQKNHGSATCGLQGWVGNDPSWEENRAAPSKPAEEAAPLRPMIYASLFAALTAVGAYLFVPIGPVPIVLQNMFVFLAGLLLGSRWGLASVAVYLLAGICGLPVFAGGTGGIGRFAGPTGGFLLGYLPAVFLVGWIAERQPGRMLRDVAAMLLGGAVAICLRGAVARDGDRPAVREGLRGRDGSFFAGGCASRSPPRRSSPNPSAR